MADVFLEVVVNAAEAATAGINSRDEVESPLEDALSAIGIGEVTGGGGGSGIYLLDVEVPEDRFDDALTAIRGCLQQLRVPPSTVIVRRTPPKATFRVYEQ